MANLGNIGTKLSWKKQIGKFNYHLIDLNQRRNCNTNIDSIPPGAYQKDTGRKCWKSVVLSGLCFSPKLVGNAAVRGGRFLISTGESCPSEARRKPGLLSAM